MICSERRIPLQNPTWMFYKIYFFYTWFNKIIIHNSCSETEVSTFLFKKIQVGSLFWTCEDRLMLYFILREIKLFFLFYTIIITPNAIRIHERI